MKAFMIYPFLQSLQILTRFRFVAIEFPKVTFVKNYLKLIESKLGLNREYVGWSERNLFIRR